MHEKIDLLDYLAFKCGCTYLSDLPRECRQSPLLHVLRQITPSAFSLQEWNDAFHYLTGQKGTFDNEDVAMGHLIAYVSKQS